MSFVFGTKMKILGEKETTSHKDTRTVRKGLSQAAGRVPETLRAAAAAARNTRAMVYRGHDSGEHPMVASALLGELDGGGATPRTVALLETETPRTAS